MIRKPYVLTFEILMASVLAACSPQSNWGHYNPDPQPEVVSPEPEAPLASPPPTVVGDPLPRDHDVEIPPPEPVPAGPIVGEPREPVVELPEPLPVVVPDPVAEEPPPPAPPAPTDREVVEGFQVDEIEPTQLDIVFIIDNSESMSTYRNSMRSNINLFLDRFQNRVDDLRVGVMSIYDGVRFRTFESDRDEEYLKAKTDFEVYTQEFRSSYPNYWNLDLLNKERVQLEDGTFYQRDYRYSYFKDSDFSQPVLPRGFLRPPRFINGEHDLTRRFLTGSDPDFLETLSSSLMVTDIFEGQTQRWADQGSPVIEEIFSVIRTFPNQNLNETVNQNFFRKSAHLAIVVLTDAEDATFESRNGQRRLVEPGQVASEIINFKGSKEKIRAYGVLSLETTEQKCEPTDYQENNRGEWKLARPDRISEFIEILGGSTYSMCSPDFGSHLANIGQDLVTSISVPVFQLRNIPSEPEKIVVTYNGREVSKAHWVYNRTDNSITITGGEPLDGGAVDIRFKTKN